MNPANSGHMAKIHPIPVELPGWRNPPEISADKLKDSDNQSDDDDTEERIARASWRLRASIGCFILIYTLLGAWVFQLLERSSELKALEMRHNNISSARLKLLISIQKISEDSKTKTDLETKTAALAAIAEYDAMIDAILDGKVKLFLNRTEEPHINWGSFTQAYFFVLTLITTIGYGTLVPATTWGRIFCVNYALIGIPIMLIFIAQTGALLARWATGLSIRVFGKDPLTAANATKMGKMIGTSLSIVIVVFLLFGYLGIGAVLFDVTESWGFINSFYFCFITLTTIGFGDMVPNQGTDRTLLVYLRAIYTIWGLAITSTAISLVRNHYSEIWLNADEQVAIAIREGSQTSNSNSNKDKDEEMIGNVN